MKKLHDSHIAEDRKDGGKEMTERLGNEMKEGRKNGVDGEAKRCKIHTSGFYSLKIRIDGVWLSHSGRCSRSTFHP